MGENGKASMTLDALEVGACAIIDGVNGSGELRRHLLDMGLTPGVGVRVGAKWRPWATRCKLSCAATSLLCAFPMLNRWR